MCIAIAQPKGIKIDDDTLNNCWKSNPDFAGIAYAHPNGYIAIDKYFTFESLKRGYHRAFKRHGATSDFVLHFRIATHGGVNAKNTHPFRVGPKLVLAHNGIIDIKIPKDRQDMSDTRYFIDSVLKHLPDGWHTNDATLALIKKYIGWSKLVLLDDSGQTHIVNADLGVTEGGVWYSNNSFRPVTRIIPRTTYNYTAYGNWFKDEYSDLEDDVIGESALSAISAKDKESSSYDLGFDDGYDEGWQQANKYFSRLQDKVILQVAYDVADFILHKGATLDRVTLYNSVSEVAENAASRVVEREEACSASACTDDTPSLEGELVDASSIDEKGTEYDDPNDPTLDPNDVVWDGSQGPIISIVERVGERVAKQLLN